LLIVEIISGIGMLAAFCGLAFITVKHRDWRLGLLAAPVPFVALYEFGAFLPGTIGRFFPPFSPEQWNIRLLVASGAFFTFIVLERVLRERDRTESKLRDSQNLLTDAIESISEGFVLYDADDRFVMCNEHFFEIYPWCREFCTPGLPFEEMARSGRRAGMYPQAEGHAQTWLIERLKQHRDFDATYQRQLSDGRWIMIRNRPTASGGVVGIRTDITEIKMAQQALDESENRFAAVVDSIAVPTTITRKSDGAILRINRMAAELDGRTVDQMIGRKAPDNWRDPAARGEFIAKLERDGRVDSFEFSPSGLADGHLRHFVVSAREIPYAGEQAIISSYMDISAQKAAAAEIDRHREQLAEMVEERTADLLASQEKLRDLIDGSLQGINVQRNFKPLFCNDVYARMHGYEVGEILAMESLESLFPPAEFERLSAYSQRRLGGEEMPAEYEFQARKKDGSLFWAANRSRMVSWEGEPAIQNTLIDVTERKETQAKLTEARNFAEAANAAKTDFLSSMSHELRTPLNAVLGFSEILKTDPSRPLSSEQQESVDQIWRAGRHLLNLIGDVLDLSKIETGNLEVSLEDVNLKDVLEDCVDLVTAQADSAGITVELEPSPDLLVRADQTRLRQVVLNLMSNAIKYNRPGGQVRLSVGAQMDGVISIAVSDTGRGISREHLDDLFQPFNRLGYENSAIEGTGVGLAITAKLVEAMNGSIEVDSEVDQGSCFRVHLPLTANAGEGFAAKAPNDDDENVAPARTGGAAATVLYIEDNPSNQLVMKKVIARLPDVELLVAGDAETGLVMAQRENPGVILMDINLPGMSGIEALAELGKTPSTAHIPVIAISANAMPSQVKKGKQAGFVDYLTKPIEIKAVLDAVQKALRPGE